MSRCKHGKDEAFDCYPCVIETREYVKSLKSQLSELRADNTRLKNELVNQSQWMNHAKLLSEIDLWKAKYEQSKNDGANLAAACKQITAQLEIAQTEIRQADEHNRSIQAKAERYEKALKIIASGEIPGATETPRTVAKSALAQDAPDKNCITRADGECIGKDCMHEAEYEK